MKRLTTAERAILLRARKARPLVVERDTRTAWDDGKRCRVAVSVARLRFGTGAPGDRP